MFIIFGWNHQKSTNYGAVEKRRCQNCNNEEFWQLDKITNYFTLFFIPIIPLDKNYWFHCPICNYGIKLTKNEFENYKSIADINSDYLENTISEEERIERLEDIYNVINQINTEKKTKNIEESKEWMDLASQKTNNELISITREKRNEYNPAFVIAAEMEIEKRGLNKK